MYKVSCFYQKVHNFWLCCSTKRIPTFYVYIASNITIWDDTLQWYVVYMGLPSLVWPDQFFANISTRTKNIMLTLQST